MRYEDENEPRSYWTIKCLKCGKVVISGRIGIDAKPQFFNPVLCYSCQKEEENKQKKIEKLEKKIEKIKNS